MMSDSISIIGGADGPTSVFIAGKLGMNWLNVFGLIFVVLLLIPNIIYTIKVKNHQNKCTNEFMNVIEQIGRYGCMFLMVFNIGVAEFGFRSVGAFLVYLFGNALLIILYWIMWMLYFNKQTYRKQILLALIPTCIFLLSGITMLHYLLVIFGVLFGIGHIYVTNKNRENQHFPDCYKSVYKETMLAGHSITDLIRGRKRPNGHKYYDAKAIILI